MFLGGTPGTIPEPLMVNGIPKGRMAGETPGRADMGAQTTQAIESLKLAVEIAGGNWEDVLRLNLFVTYWCEIDPFLDAYQKACAPGAPAETLARYGLYMPSMIMEIEGIAAVGKSSPITPAKQPKNKYAPSNAGRRIGDLLCLSALLPLDADGKVVHTGNPRAQTEAIIKDLSDTLEKNGASLNDTVRLRVYVREFRDVADVKAAIAAAFPDPAPVTTVIVAPTPIVEATVMIEPTAYVGEKIYETGPGNARAVIVGDMGFTNGIISVDESGTVVHPDDISGQTQKVLKDAKTLLEKLGMSVADITQSQITVPDYRDFDAYNVFYRDFVPFPFPARSTAEAGIGDFEQRGLKYQIELTAVRNASEIGIVATAEENYYFQRIEIENKSS